jgi:hypothetical protein
VDWDCKLVLFYLLLPPLPPPLLTSDPEWNNPEGVPISAIVFGMRHESAYPLVYEGTNRGGSCFFFFSYLISSFVICSFISVLMALFLSLYIVSLSSLQLVTRCFLGQSIACGRAYGEQDESACEAVATWNGYERE